MDKQFVEALFNAAKNRPNALEQIVESLAMAGDTRSLRLIMTNDLVDLSALGPEGDTAPGLHAAMLPLLYCDKVNHEDAKALVTRWLGSVEGGLQNAIDILLRRVSTLEDVRALMTLGADPNRILPADSLTAFGHAFRRNHGAKLGLMLKHYTAHSAVPMYCDARTIFQEVADPGQAIIHSDAIASLAEVDIPATWRTSAADALEVALGVGTLSSKSIEKKSMGRYFWLMTIARPTTDQWTKILRGRDGDSFVAKALVRPRDDESVAYQVLRNMRDCGFNLETPICLQEDYSIVPLLHEAARLGNVAAVSELLHLGADPNTRFARPGKEPRDACAFAQNHPDTQALLKAWAARAAIRAAGVAGHQPSSPAAS